MSQRSEGSCTRCTHANAFPESYFIYILKMEYGWNLGLKVSFMIHTYLTKKTVKIDSIFKLKKLANGKRIQKVLSIALLLYRESFWFWKSKQETPKSIPPYLFAKSLATSLPIPEVAPVTRATFPSKILGLSEPLVGHFKSQEISAVIFFWPLSQGKLLPCPSTGPKMFYSSGTNLLGQTKNKLHIVGSSKLFVPAQKT